MLPFAPSSSPPGVCQPLVGCWLVYLFESVSGVSLLAVFFLSSSACGLWVFSSPSSSSLASCSSLLGSLFCCISATFSSCSVVLSISFLSSLLSFSVFSTPVLCHSFNFLHEVFAGSFLRLGVLPLGGLSVPHPCASLPLGSSACH